LRGPGRLLLVAAVAVVGFACQFARRGKFLTNPGN